MSKHSVLLKEELCEGCTNCVKNCPTKAIRVHQGKAMIKEELCIDCAECIRTCAYHAKYSKTDTLLAIEDYDYPIVLIPPSFYGQFENVNPIEVKKSLYKLGFKEVLDVALAAEALTKKTLDFLNKNTDIYISSSCPVVVRLIKILYPELIEYLIPLKSPVELMAEKARTEMEEKGISAKELGIFFITPCPAKNTTIFSPMGIDESFLDKAISVDLVYQAILEIMKEDGKAEKSIDSRVNKNSITTTAEEQKTDANIELPYLGFSWGQSGGEVQLLQENMQKKTLSVSGIHNVKSLLDEIARNNIKGIKYFELVACNQGCVGGVFNVMNPFQAKFNLLKLKEKYKNWVKQDYSKYNFELTNELQAIQVGSLDVNMEKAMAKLIQLEKEIDGLPGLDCAACGAPDCKTLAEDIVNGTAKQSDCIFLLRQQVGDLADKLSDLAHAIPPVMKDSQNQKEE